MGYFVTYTIIAIIYIYMAIYTLSKNMYDSKNRLNFTVTMTLAIWALINSVMFLITDPVIAAATRRYMSFCWGTVYSTIFHLIVVLSGTYKKISKRKLIIPFYISVYGPALINIVLYFFNPYPASALELSEKGWVIKDFLVESFWWNNYFYFYYVVFMISAIIILIRWRKVAIKKAEIKQTNILIITFVIAMVFGSALEIILPIAGIYIISGITLYVALVPVAGIWYAIDRYSLMAFNPQQLTGEMLSLMSDGLFVIDEEGTVILMNQGTNSILGYEMDSKIRLEDITDMDLSDSISSALSRFRDVNGQWIDVLVSTLPIRDKLEEVYGIVLIFQDIREIRSIQNELEAVNSNLEKLIEERTIKLRAINNDLVGEIAMRKKAEKHILKLANYDHLTSLPNMRLFRKKVLAAIRTYERLEEKFAILFIDLDDFKSINDTLGHKVGDELLIAISGRLNGLHANLENVTRNGGDEFLVLITGDVDIEKEVKKVALAFNEPFKFGQLSLNITSSIGVAIYPDHGLDYDSMIVAADIAMYEAKGNSNRRYKFYDERMNNGLKDELELTNELFEAFKNDELSVVFQPIVDGASKSIVGAEALIRWCHPRKGYISPMVFVPLAEKTGMIDKVTEIVFEGSKIFLDGIDQSKLKRFKIAINISAVQLNDEHFFKVYNRYKVDYASLLESIEFEVTENAFIANKNIAIDILETIRKDGITVAVDDFGVNYSSLNYIKELPINKLKIDKIFVDGIGLNPKDEGIIIAIIALAKHLGLSVIAEGVENANQVEFLLEHNCRFIQGYYYYKPMNRNDFMALLESYCE